MLQFGVRCLELYSCRKKVLRGAEADAVFVIPNDIEIRETYMIGGRKPTPAVPISQAPLLIATVLEKKGLGCVALGRAQARRGAARDEAQQLAGALCVQRQRLWTIRIR